MERTIKLASDGQPIGLAGIPFEKFRKKPITIRAFKTNVALDIETLEGVMRANEDDWVIEGIKGEFYPCKPDIFEATYEKIT